MLDQKLSTEAAVNRDAEEREMAAWWDELVEVAAMKAFLGFVENWRLTQAPTEVQVAFMDAQFVLWA